jgi:hypothetical protein
VEMDAYRHAKAFLALRTDDFFFVSVSTGWRKTKKRQKKNSMCRTVDENDYSSIAKALAVYIRVSSYYHVRVLMLLSNFFFFASGYS